MKDYSQERVDYETQIKALWDNGVPISKIEKELPIRPAHIKKIIGDMRAEGLLLNKPVSNKKIEKQQKIIDLFRQGLNKYEIAEQMGIKSSYVNFVLASNKSTFHARPKKNYVKTSSQKLCEKTNLIIADIKNGLTAKEIGEKYSVSKQYVSIVRIKYCKD